MSSKISLADKKKISAYRTTIESAFYANNVVEVKSVAEAYELAKKSPGTMEIDQPIYKPEAHGLPKDANVLLFNDGTVFGRCAAARRIAGTKGVDEKTYSAILREAVYNMRSKKMYKTQAYVGLDEKFIIKANLCIPEGFENNMLSWLLNFQAKNSEYDAMYKKSKEQDVQDIFVLVDPYWSHPDFPLGLSFADPDHNCICILGMRYFGEMKKGTLTLAWKSANKVGFASCHGGLKRYNNNNFVAAVFGLSGSGKSTITHAKHGGKYDVTVLHDDAFVINVQEGYSIALEPAYFDKTQDYPIEDIDNNKFILTAQNCGVSVDENGKKKLVTEDIRNGNGRAVKSKLWTPNRVDCINEKINAIFWLMKDPTLPAVIKITDPVLGASLGATLATKRTTAERLAPGVDPNALVVEPYANPFRTYPLAEDYNKFKELLANGVECYILNTGHFGEEKVKPADTLGAVEAIIEGNAKFSNWLEGLQLMVGVRSEISPNMSDKEYLTQLKARMEDRVKFFESRDAETNGFDVLPAECAASVKKVIEGILVKA